MKKVWYLSVEHVPIKRDGTPDGPAIIWAHGKGDAAVVLEEVTEDWLKANAFKTEASAIRTSYRARSKYKDAFWDVGNVYVFPAEIPDERLHYKIYKCYEIVIQDEDGNEIGEASYCYGSKEDAEKMAKRELKIALMEGEK